MAKQISAGQRQINNQLLSKALLYVHPDENSLAREAGAYLAWKNESPTGSPMGAALEDLGSANESNAWSRAYNIASSDSDLETVRYRTKIKHRYAVFAHKKVLEIVLMHLPLTINNVIKACEEPLMLDDYV